MPFLAGWDEGTLTKTREYTFSSDLYQVGRIMANFPKHLSVEGAMFRDQLLRKEHKTTSKALADGWVGCKGGCERH